MFSTPRAAPDVPFPLHPRAFDYADRYLVRPDELVKKLLTNIVGFDLNPLAVIAARTNFLFSLGTLIKKAPQIEIPVYFVIRY